jgi:ribosomal protein L29
MALDDDETLLRRARFRELIEHCFENKQALLGEHIQAKTGKKANSGELSTLKQDNGPRSFGDKKARALCEQIGLHRQWFAMPLGTNLRREEWLLPPPNGNALSTITELTAVMTRLTSSGRMEETELQGWLTALKAREDGPKP